MNTKIIQRVLWQFNVAVVRLAIWLLKLSGWYVGYWNHWRTINRYVERNGLHILPVHYYSPIPDSRNLPAEIWSRHRFPSGFNLNIDSALHWLEEITTKYRKEYRNLPDYGAPNSKKYHYNNNAYTFGDAEVLYSIVRETKPRRMIEIGSGFSTLLTCEAIRCNAALSPSARCELVAIDPFPPSYLSPPPTELTRIETAPVQKFQ